MPRRTYYIIKSHYPENSNDNSLHIDLPHDKAAKLVMTAKGYTDYISKHGYHFTNELAELASSAMKNSDGTTHRWSAKQVSDAIKAYGISLTNINSCTPGDMCYLANMAYADGLYEGLPDSDKWCLKYAAKIADDIDGYEGMPFMRWLSDIIGKEAIDIDWTMYVK